MKEVSGKQRESFVCMMYGQPGIGKTTFASHAPSPVFIGDEENKEIDSRKIIVDKFSDVSEALGLLNAEKYKDIETIVIDSISSLEDKLKREVIASDPYKKKTSTINSVHGGYGRGVDIMANQVGHLISVLQDFSSKGKNIVVLCHSQKDTEEDPTLLKSNTFYRPSLERKTLRLWEKWLPVILFARDKIVLDSDSSKTKSIQDRRVIYTQYRASHYGKNRYGFPYELEFKPDVISSLIELKDKFYGRGESSSDKSRSLNPIRSSSFVSPATFNIDELKAIYSRIPENIKPDIDWSKINKKNFEVSKKKLMELAE